VRARQHNRLVDLDDDELAIGFWQSPFADWPSVDRGLRAFLAVERITWDGGEDDDYDRLYDVTVCRRPQDGDHVFWQFGPDTLLACRQRGAGPSVESGSPPA
jgi:hypothetical protein